jgi:MarR family transcriptional regulator, organic hydroperoxide resistance regulator
LWALQELAEAPGLRVGELAACMALHQSTASNLIERLEQLGLARRERSTVDQRVVFVTLTDLGRKTLATAPSPARGLLPEALRQMAPDDLQRLQVQLDAMLRQAQAMDEGFGMLPLPFNEETVSSR